MSGESLTPGMPLSEQQLEAIAGQIAEYSYARIDDFIPLSEVRNLRQKFEFLKDSGNLNQAGIGKQQNYQVQKQVRGDFINWISPDHADGSTQKLLQSIHQVRVYLNRTCFLGLKDLESHFAMYPAGTFYKRHVDRFQQNPHRVISFVCYLNEAWTETDGGELILYLPDNKNVEIWPMACRAVFFKSELEHEVKLAQRERYSVTGWMLDQLGELTFL